MIEGSWVPCECGEFWCKEHECHVHDCDCPGIEEWAEEGLWPYYDLDGEFEEDEDGGEG